MINLFSVEARRDPYALYDQLRAVGPVIHDPRSSRWMLLDHASVRRALDDHESFSSMVSPPPSAPSNWFIFTDPPRHAKLRALVMRAFTPRSVGGLEPRIREIAASLLEPGLATGAMDMARDFAIPLPIMVIAELLGAPTDDHLRLRRWSDGIVTLIDTLQGGAEAERAVADFVAVHGEMAAYVAALLDDRRRVPKEDLLTRLLQAEVDGERLTEAEILGFFELLLLAGHETTTNLIDNAVLAFVEHPAALASVRAEPALLPAAIEEVLRYRSPVQAVFRLTRKPVELAGKTIPPGALVLAMIGAANRDPTVFADPDRFDVRRHPNPHVGFGHGIHFCVGAPLARLESRVALALLLERTREIDRASLEPWEPRRAFHVHGPTRLPVRLEPA